jgi:hypothetical protein
MVVVDGSVHIDTIVGEHGVPGTVFVLIIITDLTLVFSLVCFRNSIVLKLEHYVHWFSIRAGVDHRVQASFDDGVDLLFLRVVWEFKIHGESRVCLSWKIHLRCVRPSFTGY